MKTTRWCGDLRLAIEVLDDTRPTYKVRVSHQGKFICEELVGKAPADQRPLNNSSLYDEIARSALSFATCVDKHDIEDLMEFGPIGSIIRRVQA